MHTLLGLILLSTIIANGGCNRSFNKIVGGQDADKGAHPWQVSIQKQTWAGYIHFCGGAIIDKYTVVTAAHCVEGINTSTLKAVAGKHRMESKEISEQAISVLKTIMHKFFNLRYFYMYDIALLKLKTPFEFNKFVKPITLPKPHQNHTGFCTVTGWGILNENDGYVLSEVLQEVRVPIVPRNTCLQVYGKIRILESMLCAGYAQGKRDACKGDSGGPLVCQENNGEHILAGVVSWGFGCARPNFYGVYTKVSDFVTWIEENKS